jgi:hypothetical protein
MLPATYLSLSIDFPCRGVSSVDRFLYIERFTRENMNLYIEKQKKMTP